jgi:hypothetical protein
MRNPIDEMFEKPKLEPIVLQRSELVAAATCPLQGRLRSKFTDVQDDQEKIKVVGSVIHQIASDCIKFCGGNLADAIDMINDELAKSRPDIQPEVLRAGRYLAIELARYKLQQVIGCEKPLTWSIMPPTSERGEILAVTQPDLILSSGYANRCVILDYKTGYKKRTNAEAYDDLQTQMNALGVSKKYGYRVIDFYYLETRSHTWAFARIDLDKVVGGDKENPLTLELAIEGRIFAAARLVLEKSDEAWPSAEKCPMCPCMGGCMKANLGAIMNLGLDDLDKASNEFYGTVLDFYTACQAKLDRVRALLDNVVKSGRVIVGTGAVLRDKPSNRFTTTLDEKESEVTDLLKEI